MFSINSYPGFTACLFVLLQKKKLFIASLKFGKRAQQGVTSVDSKKRGKTNKQDKKDGKMYDFGKFQQC